MMATQIGHWALRGFGGWSVQVRESGAVIGRLGLMRPEGNPDLEVGWVLGRESWGKGYATEGARAALSFGFGEVRASRIIARIAPGNLASSGVATKLGMHLDVEQTTPTHEIYVIGRDGWLE
jgi:RimJ/RimL family protein N-acetyltransferase